MKERKLTTERSMCGYFDATEILGTAIADLGMSFYISVKVRFKLCY